MKQFLITRLLLLFLFTPALTGCEQSSTEPIAPTHIEVKSNDEALTAMALVSARLQMYTLNKIQVMLKNESTETQSFGYWLMIQNNDLGSVYTPNGGQGQTGVLKPGKSAKITCNLAAPMADGERPYIQVMRGNEVVLDGVLK